MPVKRTLLERTIRDQATETDAARIRAAGCNAAEINTGTGCHLDAEMLQRGLAALKPPRESVLMIENVGNLVCPALFDLGERSKVVMLFVTEGDDKPLKYPHMFRAAEVVIITITKSDLLPMSTSALTAVSATCGRSTGRSGASSFPPPQGRGSAPGTIG